MDRTRLNFVRFQPQDATETAYNDLINLIHMEFAEANPDDPQPPRSGTRHSLEAIADHPFYDFHVYIVHHSDHGLVGSLQLLLPDPKSQKYEEQNHLAIIEPYVAPEHRRQGIGTAMLRFATDICDGMGLTTYEGGTTHDSGKAFANWLHAKVALEEFDVRVNLTDIDWGMIDNWYESGQQRNPDTRLIQFDGLYSEDEAELARFCEFISAVRKDMPAGDLVGTQETVTPDQLRRIMEMEAKRGVISHYLMCVEADGHPTGFTRVNYRPDYGHYIGQRVTGVLAEERGRGLGKWLKAGMLRFIKATYPDVEQIKTSYASVNDPMISINKRIGFQPYNHLILYTAMIADIKPALDIP